MCSDALALDAFDISLILFDLAGLRLGSDGLLHQLAHQSGDICHAPIADEHAISDAENLGRLCRDMAARGRNALVLAVMSSGHCGPDKDPITRHDELVESDVEIGERLEIGEASAANACHDALVGEKSLTASRLRPFKISA
jgi:hypothetical protein